MAKVPMMVEIMRIPLLAFSFGLIWAFDVHGNGFVGSLCGEGFAYLSSRMIASP